MKDMIKNKSHYFEKVILNIIREEGIVSRININKMTGIRPSTITEITKRLLDQGIIMETGSLDKPVPRGGKKDLFLNKDYLNIIGIDIQAHAVLAILTNFCGEILTKEYIQIDSNSTKEKIQETIFYLIDKMIEASGDRGILGIGLAALGIMDRKTQSIALSSELPNWKDIKLKEIIEGRYQYTVCWEDQVISKLLAEKWLGHMSTYENVVLVDIGEIFAASIIYNNNVLRSSKGILGEIGHFSVSNENKLCVCGNRGCLQTVASSGVVIQKVKEALKSGAISVLNDYIEDGDMSKIDIDMILEAAENGDRIAINILSEAAMYIGQTISYIINLLNPELVIFSGEMINEGDYLSNQIIEEIKKKSLYLTIRDVKFQKSSLGRFGGAIGAVCLVLDEYFKYSEVVKTGFII